MQKATTKNIQTLESLTERAYGSRRKLRSFPNTSLGRIWSDYLIKL